MPILSLDFSNAPARQPGSLTLVPPGTYTLRVTGADDTPAKSGEKMLTVIMKIDDGPNAGEEFRDYFVNVPAGPDDDQKGMSKFRAFLNALGYEVKSPKINQLDTDKHLVGKTCRANIYTAKTQVTEQFPEARDVSKIKNYELPSGYITQANAAPTNGKAPAAKAAPVMTAAPEPEEADAADGMSVDESGEDLFS